MYYTIIVIRNPKTLSQSLRPLHYRDRLVLCRVSALWLSIFLSWVPSNPYRISIRVPLCFQGGSSQTEKQAHTVCLIGTIVPFVLFAKSSNKKHPKTNRT